MTTATGVRERPILFSGPMVRAILEGRKTQTRRIVKNTLNGHFQELSDGTWEWSPDGGFDRCVAKVLCPYGTVEDRLWVREAWAYGCAEDADEKRVVYRADIDELDRDDERFIRCLGSGSYSFNRWRPSIHMPRRWSRITLEITKVRAERVQEISGEDAGLEGVTRLNSVRPPQSGYVAGFAQLWDSINLKRGFGWGTNPWVWVIEFRKVA